MIDCINYAKNYREITDEQYEIILACRKTVLKNDDSAWIKTGLNKFNVSMGGYDSAQIADLVGFYILNTLSRIMDLIQIGLYCNDIHNIDDSKCSCILKKIIRTFKFLRLKIEIFQILK